MDVIGRKYRVGVKIGSGSFGEVYLGTDLQTEERVAIKMERVDARQPCLYHEYKIYGIISPVTGIPKVRWYGTESDHYILVMDRLGPSLEELFRFCGHKFSLKTVLMLADQLIDRIERIHATGVLHRDLKPQNILMGIGIGQKSNVVHMIDFGVAKYFGDPKTFRRIPKETKSLTGTPRYASIKSHNCVEQSRRDDLESLGYVLLYFLRGSLPWQGHDNIARKKMATSIEFLCKSHPKEFASYFHYCRSLGFDETPDYAYLKSSFRDLFVRQGFQYDNMFDWTILAQQRMAQSSRAVLRLPPQQAPPPPAIDMVPRVKDGHGSSEKDTKRDLKISVLTDPCPFWIYAFKRGSYKFLSCSMPRHYMIPRAKDGHGATEKETVRDLKICRREKKETVRDRKI